MTNFVGLAISVHILSVFGNGASDGKGRQTTCHIFQRPDFKTFSQECFPSTSTVCRVRPNRYTHSTIWLRNPHFHSQIVGITLFSQVAWIHTFTHSMCTVWHRIWLRSPPANEQDLEYLSKDKRRPKKKLHSYEIATSLHIPCSELCYFNVVFRSHGDNFRSICFLGTQYPPIMVPFQLASVRMCARELCACVPIIIRLLQ